MLIFAVTASELKVPTDVMFGCAFVVTVPAVVAEPAVPAEVAKPAVPALPALTAYVAFATVPDTFAPGIAVSPVAAP